jgi:hypothetical protein
MNAMDVSKNRFVPLSEEEARNTCGGFGVLAAIAVGLAIAAGAEIFSDWDNFKAGLMGRPEI